MGGGYEINLLKSGKIKSYGIGFIEDYSEKGIFGTGKILWIDNFVLCKLEELNNNIHGIMIVLWNLLPSLWTPQKLFN